MDTKIKVDINIDGTPIEHFSSFTLDQKFNEHHTFQLRLNHDQIEGTNNITLEKSKDFIGKNLTIQFGVQGGTENQFTGKITKVEISQTHGFQGDVLISGYSPSILIDRGPDLGSYLAKDLKTIVQQATADAPSNDLSIQIKPAYSSTIDYMIQYRETDFDFINRLSAEYHEWFYYDGTKLNFGKPDKLEEVNLIYGRDLYSMQYGLQVAPLNYKKFAYHSPEDQVFSAQPAGSSSGSPDLSHAISASNQVYSKQYTEPLDVRINSQKEIDTFVNDEHKAIVSELLKLMGNGDNPQVGLGKIVNISTSMRSGTDFNVQDFGKFLVTSVYHQLDGVGHYQNTFEAISADSEKLQVDVAEKPMPDMQLAMVVDNADPQNQGRVKVQFKWDCTCNDPTEWLRVMTPDAGSSEKVSNNRGFVFIPEKGDQVIVAFEEGNIARPIIMGSMFHGKNSAGGSASNNNKSLTSKSGHTFFMNDAAGMLLMDKTGLNHIMIDGKNKITATSDNDITLQTGNVMIIMNKAEDKIIIQAKNIEIRAADDFKVTGDGGPSKNGSMTFQTKLAVSVKEELSMSGEKTTSINGKEITIVGHQTTIDGKPVKINS